MSASFGTTPGVPDRDIGAFAASPMSPSPAEASSFRALVEATADPRVAEAGGAVRVVLGDGARPGAPVGQTVVAPPPEAVLGATRPPSPAGVPAAADEAEAKTASVGLTESGAVQITLVDDARPGAPAGQTVVFPPSEAASGASLPPPPAEVAATADKAEIKTALAELTGSASGTVARSAAGLLAVADRLSENASDDPAQREWLAGIVNRLIWEDAQARATVQAIYQAIYDAFVACLRATLISSPGDDTESNRASIWRHGFDRTLMEVAPSLLRFVDDLTKGNIPDGVAKRVADEARPRVDDARVRGGDPGLLASVARGLARDGGGGRDPVRGLDG